MAFLARRIHDIVQDVRFAARTLAKTPGFTAVAVLSIALGIGANTAIFTLIDAVMWRLLPVKDPQSLLAVVRSGGAQTQAGFTYKTYRAMRDSSHMAELTAYTPVRMNVSVDGNVEPTIDGQLISGNYLPLLGVNPIAGRAIGPSDDLIPNGHPVAMISYGYWSRRFGLAPSTVGRTISISGKPFTIIGVTPPEFFGAEAATAPDIFVPLMMQPTVAPAYDDLNDRTFSLFFPLARLKPGFQRQQAARELEAVYRQQNGPPFRADDPKLKLSDEAKKWSETRNPELHVTLIPAASGFSGLRQQFSQSLLILMAAVGVVLLIACANTASLLLARAAARRPEFTMRLTLGASRARLVGQLLVESLMLAALGGVCGILLARWATKLLVLYMSTGRNPITLNLNPDARILWFTAAVSMLTGVLFGLAPALRGTRIDLAPSLKGAGNLLNARGRFSPGKILAVFQVALSLVLLIGAGLFVRSLQNLHRPDAAGGRESVLTLRVVPSDSEKRDHDDKGALDRIYRDLIRRVEDIPGVRSVSMAEITPTNSAPGSYDGIWLASGKYSEPIGVFEIYPNYFKTAGIAMLAGRDLTAQDEDVKAPDACVVNQAFVDRFYPARNPIGAKCAGGQVVGVVKDSRLMNPSGAIEPMIFETYLHSHTGRGGMVLYVRTEGNSNPILARIREEVQNVDPAVPQFEVRTLAEEMDAALVRERMIATLSSLFGILALLLACVGLYGLFAFAVLQRTGELGIRMALGAPSGDVLRMVLREAMALVLAGVAIGVPAALAAGRLASSRIPNLLFDLKSTDPTTIVSSAALLLLIACAAAYVPARRASRVDPMVALRNE